MRESGVFVDTSAWYALAATRDASHDRATRTLRAMTAARRRLVTSNHVASETYTLIRVRLGHQAAQTFLRGVGESAVTQRVFVPEEWERGAEALLAQYADQDFSYVDATSFVLMRRLGLVEAFTFDHHFSVAGFVQVEA